MDTEGGGEVGTSQLQSKHKMGHMTNIYLMDSNEEAVVDFVKNQEELYYKTNEKFKARKECLWERFANSFKCEKLGSNLKGLTTAKSHSSNLVRLQKK